MDPENDDDDDNNDDDEPPQEPPTAAEIVQAGVARGQFDLDSVPIDQCELDETEQRFSTL